MAAKNVGTLIKEGRTAKKLSQEQLAAGIDGLSASDVSKAERGEKELSQVQLRAIAKALGVTQKSLLEAPKGGTSSTTSNAARKNTSTAKTSTAKTASSSSTATTAKTSTASKTGTASKKTTTSKGAASTENLSSTERKLVELYRAADSESKKLATRILKGEKLELGDVLPILMNNGTIGEDGLLGSLLGKVQNMMK